MRMCLGSGRVHNASRRVAGQYVKRCYRCGAAREDLPVSSKGKGDGKGNTATDCRECAAHDS